MKKHYPLSPSPGSREGGGRKEVITIMI